MGKQKESTEMAIPFTTAIDVVDNDFSVTPYVQFAHHNSPAFPRIIADCPAVEDGDPVLCLDKRFHALEPLKFLLMAAKSFSVLFDAQGAVMKAKRESDRSWKDLIEAALLVFHGETLVPARCTFKTAKCGAVRAAIDGVRLAEQDDVWGAKGKDHQASLQIRPPWARVVTTVRITSRTGGSGNPYNPAVGTVTPTSAREAGMIAEFLRSEDHVQVLKDVAADYEKRVRELEGKK